MAEENKSVASEPSQKTVGLVLAFLGPTVASRVLAGMEEHDVWRAVGEVARIDDEAFAGQPEAISEIHEHLVAQELLADHGASVARTALEREFGETEACRLLENLSLSCMAVPGASQARGADVIEGLGSHRTALVLAFLPDDLAARVLAEMGEDRACEALLELASLPARLPDFFINEQEAGDGVDLILPILNELPSDEAARAVAKLDRVEPELAREINRRSRPFEDLLLCDSTMLAHVLEQASHGDLTLALSAAPARVRARILASLEPARADVVARDIESLGPIRLGDVELAQRRILDGIDLLERQG